MASRFNFFPFQADPPPTSNAAQEVVYNLRPVLIFDGGTDWSRTWSFIAPVGITTPLTLVLHLAMEAATSGTVGWQAQLEAVTPGDPLNIITTDSFDSVNNSASTTVPGTIGYEFTVSITLTNNDGIAAGDICRIKISRDADGSAVTDSVTTNAYLYAAELKDAA